MPYIPEFRRAVAWERGRDGSGPANVGELTYVLYRTVLQYLDGARAFNKYAEALAALECAKLELYRAHVGPYEQLKLEANGDV